MPINEAQFEVLREKLLTDSLWRRASQLFHGYGETFAMDIYNILWYTAINYPTRTVEIIGILEKHLENFSPDVPDETTKVFIQIWRDLGLEIQINSPST